MQTMSRIPTHRHVKISSCQDRKHARLAPELRNNGPGRVLSAPLFAHDYGTRSGIKWVLSKILEQIDFDAILTYNISVSPSRRDPFNMRMPPAHIVTLLCNSNSSDTRDSQQLQGPRSRIAAKHDDRLGNTARLWHAPRR